MKAKSIPQFGLHFLEEGRASESRFFPQPSSGCTQSLPNQSQCVDPPLIFSKIRALEKQNESKSRPVGDGKNVLSRSSGSFPSSKMPDISFVMPPNISDRERKIFSVDVTRKTKLTPETDHNDKHTYQRPLERRSFPCKPNKTIDSSKSFSISEHQKSSNQSDTKGSKTPSWSPLTCLLSNPPVFGRIQAGEPIFHKTTRAFRQNILWPSISRYRAHTQEHGNELSDGSDEETQGIDF